MGIPWQHSLQTHSADELPIWYGYRKIMLDPTSIIEVSFEKKRDIEGFTGSNPQPDNSGNGTVCCGCRCDPNDLSNVDAASKDWIIKIFTKLVTNENHDVALFRADPISCIGNLSITRKTNQEELLEVLTPIRLTSPHFPQKKLNWTKRNLIFFF